MNTQQTYNGTQAITNLTEQPAQNVSPSIEPITLVVSAGNQFHELFFALTQARSSALEEIIADFDPNELEPHVQSMRDLADIDDLISNMVIELNRNVEKYEDAHMTEHTRSTHAKAKLSEVSKWQKIVAFHPNRNKTE